MSRAPNPVIMLPRVRLAVCAVFNPFSNKNDDGQDVESYVIHALMGKDHPGIEIVKQAQRQVGANAWPSNHLEVLNALAQQDRLALHDGNITKVGVDKYKDQFFVIASRKKDKGAPSVVVTRNGVNVSIAANDPFAPYPGCWANVFVEIWALGADGAKPTKGGRRLVGQLNGVQFLEHDEPLGSVARVARPDEFPVVATKDADAAPPASASSGLV